MTILGERTATATRFTPGTIVAGDYSDTIESTFPIVASYQPNVGREMGLEGNAQRTQGRWSMYADEREPELFTARLDPDGALIRRPDRVNFGGRDYEVAEKRDWRFDVTGIPHLEYELIEVGIDEGS